MKFNKLRHFFVFILLAPTFLYAQCDLSGIADSYLLTDDPITLIGSPAGGTFSGVGVSGGIFDPAVAGEGVHLIYYAIPESGTGNKYLIQSELGDPWGAPANQELMNWAFGGDTEWIYEEFETMDVDAVFADSTGFIFLDGSSFTSAELNAFLIANILAIEEWVNNGGRLYLNAAPNEGGDINFGFDGTSLFYNPDFPTYTSNVSISDVMHPAVLGPHLPVSLDMSGTFYGHGYILGTDYNDLLAQASLPLNVLLAEKNWGEGRIMVGGLVTHNFQSPLDEVRNWRANLLYYLYNDVCTKLVTVGGYAELDDIQVTQRMYPNPTQNTVQFDLLPETSVAIYSLTGQELLTPVLNPKTLDVSGLKAGVYLVVFMSQTGTSTQKLTIN